MEKKNRSQQRDSKFSANGRAKKSERSNPMDWLEATGEYMSQAMSLDGSALWLDWINVL